MWILISYMNGWEEIKMNLLSDADLYKYYSDNSHCWCSAALQL